MFTYSPALVMIVGSATCIILLLGRVWFRDIEINYDKVNLVLLIRGFFLVFFAYL